MGAAALSHVGNRFEFEIPRPVGTLFVPVRNTENALQTKVASLQGTAAVHAFENLLSRLRTISALKMNWDSYGALPPSSRALISTFSLVSSIAENYFPMCGLKALPFTVVAVPDGGVQIEWRNSESKEIVEIEASPNGTLSYLLLDADDAEKASDEAMGLAEPDILELFSKTFGHKRRD